MKDEERKELKENLKKQIDEMSDEELDKVAGGYFSYKDGMDHIQRYVFGQYDLAAFERYVPNCGIITGKVYNVVEIAEILYGNCSPINVCQTLSLLPKVQKLAEELEAADPNKSSGSGIHGGVMPLG